MKKYFSTLCITLLTVFCLNTSNAHSGLVIGTFEGCWDGCEGSVGVTIFAGGWVLGLTGLLTGSGVLQSIGWPLIVLDEDGNDQIQNLLNQAFPFIEDQEVLQNITHQVYQKINTDSRYLSKEKEIYLDQNLVVNLLETTDLSVNETQFVLKALTE